MFQFRHGMNYFNIMGFGTSMYGTPERSETDGSYVTTGWITALYFPIIPLASYRVTVGRQQGFGIGASVGFNNVQTLSLNITQVINTYALWYLPIGSIVLYLNYPAA